MKLKNLLFTLLVAASISMVGCVKNKVESPKPANSDGTQEQTHANDATEVQAETDNAVSNMENVYANGSANMGGSGKTNTLPCGVGTVVADTATKTFHLTFDSTITCDNNTRTRAGKIDLKLEASHNKWSDVGAKVTITFINFRTYNLKNGKRKLFNGSITITNDMGGVAAKASSGTFAHSVAGAMTVTFDDGSTRTWNHSDHRVWTITAPGVGKVVVSGTGTANGLSNLRQWGTNRYGDEFSEQILTSVELNTECTGHKPMSGVVKHTGPKGTITATLGVDVNGIVQTLTSGCPYGMKVEWKNTQNGASGTAILPY